MLTSLFRNRSVKMCFGNRASFLSTQENVNNILITHLKLDHDVMQKLNKLKGNNISKIPKENLIKNCTTLRKMNVNIEKIKYLEHCLTLQPRVVRNRILLLKEMGVKTIDLQYIYRFPVSMRRSVKLFKKIHGIPETENIMKNIIKNIGLTIDENVANQFDHRGRMGDYYSMCMLYYKTFYLRLYEKTVPRMKKPRYQSFQELTIIVNILCTKYKFNTEFLSNHPYLLYQSKDNIVRYLTEFKDVNFIGDKNIIEVVAKYPRFLCYPVERVKELLVLCQKLDISAQSVTSYVRSLKLTKEVFLERYISITNNRELSIWTKHPRMLSLIYSYNTAQSRVVFLKLSNRVAAANIHTYLCNELFFMRYVRGDLCRTAGRKFLLYILSKEFGKDKEHLLHNIVQHKHWKHVSLLVIVNTIEYLKKYYSVEDICENIHIVLYPQSTIKEVLHGIYLEFTPNEGYGFTSSQYLALCLYILEKKYHFSGDAIWQDIDTKTTNAGPNFFEDVDKDEYENLSKNIAANNKAIHDLNGIAWLEYLLQ